MEKIHEWFIGGIKSGWTWKQLGLLVVGIDPAYKNEADETFTGSVRDLCTHIFASGTGYKLAGSHKVEWVGVWKGKLSMSEIHEFDRIVRKHHINFAGEM